MAATLPTTPPARHVAGTSLQFTRALADYPPPAWTLSYALVKAGQRIVFTATNNGDGSHRVSVPMATTAAWPAGAYELQGYVSNGTDRHLVDTGTLHVLPDFAAQSTGYDGRSHARKVLDAIEAVLEGRAAETHLELQVVTPGGTRRVSEIPHADLLALRSQYQNEVARENAASSGHTGRGKMRVSFR